MLIATHFIPLKRKFSWIFACNLLTSIVTSRLFNGVSIAIFYQNIFTFVLTHFLITFLPQIITMQYSVKTLKNNNPIGILTSNFAVSHLARTLTSMRSSIQILI